MLLFVIKKKEKPIILSQSVTTLELFVKINTKTYLSRLPTKSFLGWSRRLLGMMNFRLWITQRLSELFAGSY